MLTLTTLCVIIMLPLYQRCIMARPKKNPDFVEKTCPTCELPFNISYRKKHQVYCSKSCAQKNPTTILKMVSSQKSTSLKKYGVDHPMKSMSVVENFKTSMVKKYGVTSALKLEKFVDKADNTRFERYGDAGYNNTDLRKKTCIERYGVDNPGKVQSIVDSATTKRKNNHYEFLLKYCSDQGVEFLCSKENYKGYHFSNEYEFKCISCQRRFLGTVYALENIFCDYCHPERISSLEEDVYKFLQSILKKEEVIIRKDRTVLVGKELDFYVPSKKLAIEMNGLYWHSEHGNGVKKNYHLNKTKSCAYHGISLLHIFENEWFNKRDIVKSIIKTSLGIPSVKVFARKCEVVRVNDSDKNVFLNKNHLQGEDKSTVKLGLKYKGELVSVMTFRKSSRFEKNVEWELTRFCNKLDTVIVGGAGKLFCHFLENYNPKMIVSYCDRRYFSGGVYQKLGFNFVKHTPPGYSVIIDKYKDLRHRMSFQKHKLSKILKSFDPLKTEWVNLVENGYDRIWDCGHSKWIFTSA